MQALAISLSNICQYDHSDIHDHYDRTFVYSDIHWRCDKTLAYSDIHSHCMVKYFHILTSLHIWNGPRLGAAGHLKGVDPFTKSDRRLKRVIGCRNPR